jgi:hypothetical protein
MFQRWLVKTMCTERKKKKERKVNIQLRCKERNESLYRKIIPEEYVRLKRMQIYRRKP